jgi:DNA-binding CsgD family transcriptional regulator
MRLGRRLFAATFKELKTHPLIPLGFALFWLWVWTVIQSSFLNTGQVFSGLPGVARWVVPLASVGLTFLVLAALYYFRRVAPQSPLYLRAFSIITSFGVVVCAVFTRFPTTDSLVTTVLLTAGALIVGAGTACLYVEWGRLFGRLGARKTIIHGTIGTIGAGIFIGIAFFLPNKLAWIVIALLPPCCCGCIIRQRQSMSIVATKDTEQKLNVPWRFLCTSFIQGTAFGILQSVLHVAEGAPATTFISVAGCLLGTVSLFLVVFFFRLDFNQLMYQIGFVILALSSVFMATTGGLFVLSWLLSATGYRFVDILMWALCAYLVKQRGLPTNWVFPVTTCALIAGQIFGALAGSFVQSTFEGTYGGLDALSVGMVFTILTGALLMSNRSNVQKGWGMIRPSDGEEQGENLLAQCALATDGFELTPREKEVFALLAQGYNKLAVSEKLFLSVETIKTHTRNIYRKMDLHSQEGLIALVAAQVKQDETPSRPYDTLS